MAFLLILAAVTLCYWGCWNNYFFSDSFEWLARGIITQQWQEETLQIHGRDFNPLYLLLMQLLTRLFNLNPTVYRLLSILTFTGVLFLFYYILCRHLEVNPVIALSTALLAGVNVFISEAVLNLAALVYPLALLFFLLALHFYLKKQYFLYLLFFTLAALTKETIFLAAIPLFFLEKETKLRWFLGLSTFLLVIARVLVQLSAGTATYTGFVAPSDFFLKCYFLLLRSMNISPYALSPWVGGAVILLLAAVGLYFAFSGKCSRGARFFLIFMALYAVFFAFLPRLSSRYFLYPALGFWGTVAFMADYFRRQRENLKYLLIPLLLAGLFYNLPAIRAEIEDYRLLGNFSQRFVEKQATLLEKISPAPGERVEIALYKRGTRGLTGVYRIIKQRGNLPKLLPIRPHAVGGVIKPQDLVPIAFYPAKIIRWHNTGETELTFTGHLERGEKQ